MKYVVIPVVTAGFVLWFAQMIFGGSSVFAGTNDVLPMGVYLAAAIFIASYLTRGDISILRMAFVMGLYAVPASFLSGLPLLGCLFVWVSLSLVGVLGQFCALFILALIGAVLERNVFLFSQQRS